MKRYVVRAATTVAISMGMVCVGSAISTSASAQTASDAVHAAKALPGQPACFWMMEFNGSWTTLSHDELIVYVPTYRQPYLIRLFHPVTTLRFADNLGFYAPEHTGQICNDKMDYLVVPNWTPHRVPITAVRKLTMAEHDALLMQHGIEPHDAGSK